MYTDDKKGTNNKGKRDMIILITHVRCLGESLHEKGKQPLSSLLQEVCYKTHEGVSERDNSPPKIFATFPCKSCSIHKSKIPKLEKKPL